MKSAVMDQPGGITTRTLLTTFCTMNCTHYIDNHPLSLTSHHYPLDRFYGISFNVEYRTNQIPLYA
jgi:hypothetical protein